MRIRTMRKPCSSNALQSWGRDVVPVRGQGWYLCKSGKMDPLVCSSAVDRDIPLGFLFSKSRRNRSWGILGPVESMYSSTPGMTSLWPPSTHFSPGVKHTYAAKDGKLVSSFLTWFPTCSLGISWTCKKRLCTQPACSSPIPFLALAKHIAYCVVCKGGRGRNGFLHICACTDGDFYSTQNFRTCPLFLRLPYLRIKRND